MPKSIEAVYEQGVLRPLEPLTLREQQRVRVTVEERPAPRIWRSTEPVNERREEMEWLAKNSRFYPGEWLAVQGGRLFAHGPKLRDVRDAAHAAGADDPIFAVVPKDVDLPWGGW